MPDPVIRFIVLGLPRSGTTWLANWLTTDLTLCLHDPFADSMPNKWPRDGRRLGISCTGAYLMPDWLAQQHCPVAVIERDPADCAASLGADVSGLKSALDAVHARRWQFDALWREGSALALWRYLVPGVPFDKLRYRLLREMQVQPHMKKWTPNMDVIGELIDRGLLKS
jgi:hypothetical protein